MTEKPKPCPFCGKAEFDIEDDGDITCNSCAYTFYDTSVDSTWWNSRPIEDSLQAIIDEQCKEIAELKDANRWISVSERLPERLGWYRVAKLDIGTGRLFQVDDHYNPIGKTWYGMSATVYWRENLPLPEEGEE